MGAAVIAGYSWALRDAARARKHPDLCVRHRGCSVEITIRVRGPFAAAPAYDRALLGENRVTFLS